MLLNKSRSLILLTFSSALAWTIFFTVRSFTPIEMRLLHVGLFGLWSFSLLRFLDVAKWRRLERGEAYLILFGVAVACELIQFWVPGHDPEWRGLSASLMGVILGVELARPRGPRKRQNKG